jgi:hypothetical protein
MKRENRPLPDITYFVPEPEGEEPEIDLEDREAVEERLKKAETRRNAHKDFDKRMGIRRDNKGNIIPTYTPNSD